MKILAVDQARRGAWAIGETDTRELLDYDVFAFGKKYTYAQVVVKIESLIERLIEENGIGAVYIEDIQMRCNVLSFKKLAQLQGVLINMMEKRGMAYFIVAPSKWQSYCRSETKGATPPVEDGAKKKASKNMSISFVKQKYGVDTKDDNLADAISILSYALTTAEEGEADDKPKEKSHEKVRCKKNRN